MEHRRYMVGRLGIGLVAACTLSLAACTAPQAPAPVAVAPPEVLIPPQPRPPLGAQAGMYVPPVNPMGVRQTINVGVSPGQLIWNFRSALNVAALDCMQAEHTAILDNYKAFLKVNGKRLTAANKEVDKNFAVAKGRAFIRKRETYMTQVYNFYALPPTLPAFCDAALAVSNDLKTVPPKQFDAFATANLARLDRVFLDFFNSYDQYRTDLAAWQQRYAPTQVSTAPLVSTTAPGTYPPTAANTTAPARP